MAAVVFVAIFLAIFRAYSFMGFVAILPLGITSLIARSGPSPSARRRAIWVGALGTLLLPFLAAIWINREMWGYYVSRPAVDRRIVETRQIETITRVETDFDARGRVTFYDAQVSHVNTYNQHRLDEEDYYVLDGRVLRALKDRQALPVNSPGIPTGRLESLYQSLCDTGRLEEGEVGYPDAKKLSGIVVEAAGRDGRPLLFVGVRGREVSNDHYPYYEFLFTSDSLGASLKLLSFQRFYYDVAGIEGLEWTTFFSLFAFVGLVPTIPVQGFLLLRGRRRWTYPVDALGLG